MICQWNRTLRYLQRLTTNSRVAAVTHAQVPTIFDRSASHFAVMDQTNLSYEEVKKVLKRSKLLVISSDNRVHETGARLKALGIPSEDIAKHPEILGVLSLTLDNHAKLLNECGFHTITAHHLAFYQRLMIKRLSLLKAHGYFENEAPSVAKILEKIPGLPSRVAEEIERNVGPIDDNYNLRDIHKRIVFYYLCWRLQGTPQRVQKVMEIYFRIRNKSLALMAESIDMLINELGFTQEKILKHGYLIHSYPDQMRTTIERVPVLGGLPVIEVVHKFPKILLTNTDTLVNTNDVLKQFSITDESIAKCFKIFTLSTKTVKNRLINIINDPQLSGFLSHPRVLFLVVNSTTAQKRLSILKELQMQCYTLNLISASSKMRFEKFTSEREDFHQGNDVIHYISESLNCDSTNLRTELKRLSHWNTVPLANIRATMLELAKRKFNPELILGSVHILLYPVEHVSETLDSINYYTPHDAMDWSPILRYEHLNVENDENKPSSSPSELKYNKKCISNKKFLVAPQSDDNVVIEWNLVLQHCLYLLEKPHHFTGNGIWAHNSSKDDRELATVTG